MVSGGNSTSGETLNSQVSPGRLIAQARENHELSPADLAQRQRLDVSVINALEHDDFDKLAGATFVKGYIRSIAKDLNIDPDPILDAYRSVTGVEVEPSLSDFESRPPAQISSSSAIVKAGSYGLVLVLVALIIFWWRSHNDRETTVTDTSHALGTEEIHTATPLSYEFAQIVHPDGPFVAPAESSANDTVQSDGDSSDSLGGVGPEANDYAVKLTTSAEAWVEISDEAGKRYFLGLAKAGKPVEFLAHEPLKFLIGNTPTVTLNINGQPIELDTLGNEGIARFQIPLSPADAAPNLTLEADENQ